MSKFYNQIGCFILTMVLLLGFGSCSDDDKNEVKDLYAVIVDKPTLNVGINESVTVKVVLGNGGYSVKSYNTAIATATIEGDVITIKSGTKTGATTVEVKDQEGVIGNISVGVGDFEIEVNIPNGVELNENETTVLTINSGNFSDVSDLTIEIVDPAIVSLTRTDPYRPYYEILALQPGETTIVITDKLGKRCEVAVTVKLMGLELDLASNDLSVNTYQKVEVVILKGYAPYTLVSESAETIAVQHQSGSNKFGIIGLAEGETKVQLTDARGQELTIEVKVGKSDRVAKVGTSKYYSVPFRLGANADESLKSLNNITFESRIYIDALNGDDGGNARINTVMGVEKIFLLRVDVRKDGSDNSQRFLQLSADDKGKVRYESKSRIETGKWYDIAVVLDASKSGDDRLALYINGMKEDFGYKTGNTNDLKNIDLTSNFFIGQSDGKRRLNGSMSYARVWSKALSSAEIASNVASGANFDAISLEAYWMFVGNSDNAIQPTNFVSLSPKSFVATANSGISDWVADPNL